MLSGVASPKFFSGAKCLASGEQQYFSLGRIKLLDISAGSLRQVVRNCGANFFIADLRHANLVFALCVRNFHFCA